MKIEIDEKQVIDLWKKGYSVERITKVLLLGSWASTTAKYENGERYIKTFNAVEQIILKFYKN